MKPSCSSARISAATRNTSANRRCRTGPSRRVRSSETTVSSRRVSEFPPLPVHRERIEVRVIFELRESLDVLSHPHPNPLPEYRERGQEKARHCCAVELYHC